MKEIALIIALMLILGTVFISGCTQQQNTTVNISNQSGNGQGQGIGNKSINNKNISNLTNKSVSNNSRGGTGIKY